MSNQFHEPFELLSEKTKDITRAINSLREELEAVDWYNQRADISTDGELRSILEHNRNEEMEHAVMLMEWLRRNMDGWNEEMETYFFTKSPITSLEEKSEEPNEFKDVFSFGASLNIGNMK
ncbi:ferritin-like domain-containing protein [uncultured Ilyobacter sp.]|uniref:ferritin-like domain-containing protein n=1 Tax=uncultured Ilyobacter sp. TaxID=544433 RepID=UPI0029C64A04|nr:ferritin-like domain-containing protein [uncultured Ilyobacter sp.]